jgi:membrane protein YdbS with pleckstrin-like domain
VRCNQCGREIANDAAFCPYCGERLAAAIVPAGADPTAPPVVRTAIDPNAAAEHPTAASERLKKEPTRFGGKDPTEEELWSGTFSPKAMLGSILLVSILTIAGVVGAALAQQAVGWLVVGGIAVFLWASLGLTLLYRRLAIRYRLTRFRLFYERGILSRVIDRIETIDIDDVTVQQGLIDRMLGIGTIVVVSSDRTMPQLRMIGIDHVKAVADLMDSTRRAERQRRGLHLEST